MERPLIIHDTYTIGEKIGEGAFSTVHKCIHIPTHLPVAIKIITKSSIAEPEKRHRFDREISILQQIDHPNIATFYELLEDENYFYIVQEFCDKGTLTKFIQVCGHTESEKVKEIFLQILNAVIYLNHNKLIHCDIKSDNILLDEAYNAKLVDFGFAEEIGQLPDDGLIRGTPSYTAPEVLQGSQNTIQSEIWSLGILLYFMTTYHLPFEDDELDGLIHSIISMKPPMPSFLSPQCSDLILKLMHKSPARRIQLDEIKRHQWFKGTELSLKDMYGKKILKIPIDDEGDDSSTESDSLDENKIDEEIISEMEKKGYNPQEVIQEVSSNHFNQITTGYKILLKKKEVKEKPKMHFMITSNSLNNLSQMLNQSPARKQNANRNSFVNQVPRTPTKFPIRINSKKPCNKIPLFK